MISRCGGAGWLLPSSRTGHEARYENTRPDDLHLQFNTSVRTPYLDTLTKPACVDYALKHQPAQSRQPPTLFEAAPNETCSSGN